MHALQAGYTPLPSIYPSFNHFDGTNVTAANGADDDSNEPCPLHADDEKNSHKSDFDTSIFAQAVPQQGPALSPLQKSNDSVNEKILSIEALDAITQHLIDKTGGVANAFLIEVLQSLKPYEDHTPAIKIVHEGLKTYCIYKSADWINFNLFINANYEANKITFPQMSFISELIRSYLIRNPLFEKSDLSGLYDIIIRSEVFELVELVWENDLLKEVTKRKCVVDYKVFKSQLAENIYLAFAVRFLERQPHYQDAVAAFRHLRQELELNTKGGSLEKKDGKLDIAALKVSMRKLYSPDEAAEKFPALNLMFAVIDAVAKA